MVFDFEHLCLSAIQYYIGLAAWYYSDLIFQQEGNDLIKYFWGDVGTMSLQSVHEAFALRQLPVSLERLQKSDG